MDDGGEKCCAIHGDYSKNGLIPTDSRFRKFTSTSQRLLPSDRWILYFGNSELQSMCYYNVVVSRELIRPECSDPEKALYYIFKGMASRPLIVQLSKATIIVMD